MNFDFLGVHRMFAPYEPENPARKGECHRVECPHCGNQDVQVYGMNGTKENQTIIAFRGSCEHEWWLVFSSPGNPMDACIFVGFGEDDEPVDYREYLASPEWREKAEAAKARAGQRCQTCNAPRSKTQLDAHHRTYERLGDELPEDITVLCRGCHELFSKNRKLARHSR